MQTTLVAAMLQSRMRPDEGQLSEELAVFSHINVCINVNMSLSRCWWFIIVGNDSIDDNIHGSYNLHMQLRCCSFVCDLMRTN